MGRPVGRPKSLTGHDTNRLPQRLLLQIPLLQSWVA